MTTGDDTRAHDRVHTTKIEAMQVRIEEALASGPPEPFDFDAFLARKRRAHKQYRFRLLHNPLS